MNGITGHRLVHLNSTVTLPAHQNVLHVPFPAKTVVTSAQMTDFMGRPVYKKATKA